jgi:hypothetical protein
MQPLKKDVPCGKAIYVKGIIEGAYGILNSSVQLLMYNLHTA